MNDTSSNNLSDSADSIPKLHFLCFLDSPGASRLHRKSFSIYSIVGSISIQPGMTLEIMYETLKTSRMGMSKFLVEKLFDKESSKQLEDFLFTFISFRIQYISRDSLNSFANNNPIGFLKYYLAKLAWGVESDFYSMKKRKPKKGVLYVLRYTNQSFGYEEGSEKTVLYKIGCTFSRENVKQRLCNWNRKLGEKGEIYKIVEVKDKFDEEKKLKWFLFHTHKILHTISVELFYNIEDELEEYFINNFS